MTLEYNVSESFEVGDQRFGGPYRLTNGLGNSVRKDACQGYRLGLHNRHRQDGTLWILLHKPTNDLIL
jgi:hypothetical protein